MKGVKQSMMAAAIVAGLGLTVQAADDAGQQADGQQQQQGLTGQDQTGAAQQAGARQSGGQQQGEMSPDGRFVKEAAISNMKEIRLAEIAMKNGQSETVKQIAKQIKQDHEQANEQLKPIAQEVGVQIPSSLPQEKQEVVSYFQSLQGKQFDQEYLSAMKAAHAHDVSKFRDKAQVAQNPQVKQFAQQTLQKLQQHKQQVMAAAREVGLPSGDDATAAGQSIDTAQPAGQRLGDESSSLGTRSDSAQSAGSVGGSNDRSGTGSSGGSAGVGQSGSSSDSGASDSGRSTDSTR